MHIYVKSFEELTTIELYAILRLRSEIFVVEQHCIYQDIDNKDQKALHIIGRKDEEIVACTRVFNAGYYFKNASIGRIAVKKEFRRYGYGRDLVKASIDAVHTFFKTTRIELSAQEYLIRFYETHGFEKSGETYLEDGIPHIRMIKTA